jgi:hypothetical protein
MKAKIKLKKPVKFTSGFDNIKPDKREKVLEALDHHLLSKSALKNDISDQSDLALVISNLVDVDDSSPKTDRTSWPKLIKKFKKPDPRGDMPLSEFLECLDDPDRKHLADAQIKGPAFFPGALSRSFSRSEDDLKSRTLLVIDLDDGFYSLKSLTEKMKELGLECIVHTLYNHSKQKGKFRVLIRLDKPVTDDIKGTISRMLCYFVHKLGEHIDLNCWRVNQIYYTPSCPPDAIKLFRFRHQKGEALKVENFVVDEFDYELIESANQPAENRTVDDFNSRGDWGDVLSSLDLTFDYSDKQGKDYYTGYNDKNGILGIVYPECNIFYVSKLAKEIGPLKAGKAYTLFDAYSLINYNGDNSATSRSLLLEGYGKPIDFNKSEELYKLSPRKKAEKLFPEIEFPLEIFPDYFRQLGSSYAKGNQCPVEFMMMAMLTVLSAAIGNSVALQIKEGWQTLLFIWLIVIDDSGTGKTHPIDSAMKPLRRFPVKGGIKFRNIGKVEENESFNRFDEFEPPKHYFTQNFSIDSLIEKFNESSRGIIIHLDEIAGLFTSMNQKKSKTTSDVNQLIALFEGKSLFSETKTGTINCWESGAAIIGGIQPTRYNEVFDEKLHENGVAQRFLPLPFNLGPQKFTDEAITMELEEQWSNILTWMYNIPIAIDPQTKCIIKYNLSVDNDGREIFQSFYDEFKGLEDFMPKEFKGHLPKLITYCLKFSGLLHLLDSYPLTERITQPVKGAIVKDAIKLARYFAGQALKLTAGKTVIEDQYREKIKESLISLHGDFKNRKLLLQSVLDKVNEQLHAKLTLSSQQLGAILRDMDLEVKASTKNKSYVYWDDDIIQQQN